MKKHNKTQERPKKVDGKPPMYPWKYKTLPVVKHSALIDVNKGRALGSTRWNAWRWVKKELNIEQKNLKRKLGNNQMLLIIFIYWKILA
jgi:hypothetical protein